MSILLNFTPRFSAIIDIATGMNGREATWLLFYDLLHRDYDKRLLKSQYFILYLRIIDLKMSVTIAKH